VTGPCEHGNGPSGSKNDEEFIDQMNDNQLLKKDSAPRSKRAVRGELSEKLCIQ
jgi:hypothetical protein